MAGTLAALLAACGPRVASDLGVAPTQEQLGLEAQMVERLNRDRAAEGLHPLEMDSRLAAIGRAHSRDMIANGFFEHDSPVTGSLDDRMLRAEYSFATARENLALDLDVEAAEDHLLESPGHYANIMSADVTHVGVGIVRGSGPWGEDMLYVTQVFARPVEVMSAANMSAAVRTRIDEAREASGLAALDWPSALMDVAEEVIGELEGDPNDMDLGPFQDRFKEATQSTNLGIRGLGVVLQTSLEPSDIEVVGTLMEPGTVAGGIATKSVKDREGHPALLVLIVLGLR